MSCFDDSPGSLTDDSDDEEKMAAKMLIIKREQMEVSAKAVKTKKHKKKKSKKEKKKKKQKADSESDDDCQWVESRPSPGGIAVPHTPAYMKTEPIGPDLPQGLEQVYKTYQDFGKGLAPGEGVAMAEYVQNGQRIPRRGEIGMTNENIESFERAGYIMSGNRHRRMEAVRLRKESQIYTAEEKRALDMYNQVARANKESSVISQFKDLSKQKQREIQRQKDEEEFGVRFGSTQFKSEKKEE